MARSIWNGSISFGLVNIPIKVYTATQSKDISFKTLCEKGHGLEYKRWCPIEKREIEWKNVKKGFEITGDRIVVIEKEDFEKIKLKSTKTIDIQEFVDASDIDPVYVEKSYYVAPKDAGEKAYALFLEALSLSHKIAIGKVVLRDKEHLVALRSYKNAIMMHVLYYAKEIRPLDEISELKEMAEVKKEEMKLAQMLIEKLTSESLDMQKFSDQYSDALREMIEAKIEGKEFVISEEQPHVEAKNLMEALKSSVEGKKKRR